MKYAWCNARHFDPDVTCELRGQHDGLHRAEYGRPVMLDGILTAQVISW